MLLTAELKRLIKEYAEADPETIALQAKRYPDIPMGFIAQQVKARQRVGTKLPSWIANEEIVFPASLSLEQCTSERVAKYKAQLMKGRVLADITGGFGVDAFVFSDTFDHVYHVERDRELSRIAAENIQAMGKSSKITAVVGDGVEWLNHSDLALDLIYVDPARRDARQLKVSGLQDCEPNLVEIWSTLLERASMVAAKLSPGLDIDSILADLRGIRELHVISLNNECKESFCIAERDYEGEATIVCVNGCKDGSREHFSFNRSKEKRLKGEYSVYSRYIYEPNSSIMKAGAFKSLGDDLGLALLSPRTRFYTSEKLVSPFPGRTFEVMDVGELRAKSAKRLFPNGKANVLARNAGISSEGLKRKLKLEDGGELFAIGVTDASECRLLLKCRRA